MAEGRTPTLLLGGTFDPVHEGHLALARTAADAFGAVVRLLPSAVPPHRATPEASADQRAAMLRLASAGDPRLVVDTRELEREGASYTVDTLQALRLELGPEAPIGLLLGADAFLGLPAWHRWERIPRLAHLVVVTRPGSRLDVLPENLDQVLRAHWTGHRQRLRGQPAGLVHQMEMASHPASATAIRQELAAGAGEVPGLPRAVHGYIVEQGLYGATGVAHP